MEYTTPNPTPVAYQELQQAFDHFNATLFDNALRPCLITFQRERRSFGYFSLERFANRDGEMVDEIALNPSYFGVRPIRESLSTLAHEMVHLWQHQHGKPSRAGYHNREWAEKMEEIGLMPSATGQPGGGRVGEKMSHYIIDAGDFAAACDQLIDQRFQLSWFDRFPPADYEARSGRPTGTGSTEGEPRDMGNTGDEAPADSREAPPMAISWSEDDEHEIEQRKAYIKPNQAPKWGGRAKYRCPTCGSQVWGKPGLSLICGAEGCENSRYDVVSS